MTKDAPAISILSPVWNGLLYIKECVASGLAQDFQNWEMIIGDNASDDGTSEYLQTIKDPRIKVYRHDKNLGVYRNIRFLYDKATAPIYTALCADDYFYPGGLRKIREALIAICSLKTVTIRGSRTVGTQHPFGIRIATSDNGQH